MAAGPGWTCSAKDPTMNAPHRDTGFFTEPLAGRDPRPFGAVDQELGRQRHEIELIASENIVSRAGWRRRAR